MSSITSRKKSIFNPLQNEKNDFWVKDEQRFGVKMLKAMGWSPGKGLGVNEDGCADAIKVRLKNDIKGVGYKERDDQWIAHQDDFNALLSDLNGGRTFTEEECRPQNLESKSKSARNRVHYHKYARYKDLSCRSEQEIASILGKRPHRPDAVEESAQVNYESRSDNSTPDMRQYFSMKMAEMHNQNESTVRLDAILDSPPKRPKSKKMKLKKVTFGDVNLDNSTSTEDHDQVASSKGDDEITETIATTRKKKRRKKHHCDDVGEIQEDYLAESSKVENNVNLDEVLEKLQSETMKLKKIKKKKNKKSKNQEDAKEFNSEDLKDSGSASLIKLKKNRKKHKKRCHDEIDENVTKQVPVHVKSKHKKRKSKSLQSGDEEDQTNHREVSIGRLIESLKTISMFESLQKNVVAINGCS